jgi:hypothetical protein
MLNQDILWVQRFQNYLKALGLLQSALAVHNETADALINCRVSIDCKLF